MKVKGKEMDIRHNIKIDKYIISVSGVLSGLALLGFVALGNWGRAAATDYSITSPTVDRAAGFVDVAFSIVNARYVRAIDGWFSTTETGGTEYLRLTSITPYSTTLCMSYSESDGKVYCEDAGFTSSEVAAGTSLLIARYAIDPETPAGSYTVTFGGSDSALNHDRNVSGSSVSDNGLTFTSTITITASGETPELATYTLTYDANGGNGSATQTCTTTTDNPTKCTITVNPTGSFTNEGYTLLGWADSSSSTTADYTNGSEIEMTGNKRIYAVWKENDGGHDTDLIDQDISYAISTVKKIYGAGDFVNPLTRTVVDGTIVYSSSDSDVAVVDSSTGEVSIVSAGTATITAVATATSTHNGATASYDLIVSAFEISESNVVLTSTSYNYTGNAIEPAIAIIVDLDGDGVTETTLQKDIDYTVTYSNNTNVGEATITIVGKGNYQGTIDIKFYIVASVPDTGSFFTSTGGAAMMSLMLPAIVFSAFLWFVKIRKPHYNIELDFIDKKNRSDMDDFDL